MDWRLILKIWAGLDIGPKCHIVAAIVPGVVSTSQEILDVEVLIVRYSQGLQIEIDPSALLLSRVKIDRYENCVLSRAFRPVQTLNSSSGWSYRPGGRQANHSTAAPGSNAEYGSGL